MGGPSPPTPPHLVPLIPPPGLGARRPRGRGAERVEGVAVAAEGGAGARRGAERGAPVPARVRCYIKHGRGGTRTVPRARWDPAEEGWGGKEE